MVGMAVRRKSSSSNLGCPRASLVDASGGGSGDVCDINATYNLQIHDAICKLKRHAIFHNIDLVEPLSISTGSGGSQAPYNPTDFANAMKSAGHYVCGCNFWWQDPLYTPCPGVPLNIVRVTRMSEQIFAEPVPFPVIMTIGVRAKFLPHEHKGGLHRCTPEELCHAMILAIVRDIDADVDAEVLVAWRRMMLSVPFRFEYQESHQQVFFRAFALREELVTSHGVVSRTAFQRIFEIARFKQLAERERGAPLSNKALADVYRSRLSSFNTGDMLAAGFIDNAMTVYERAARIPEVQAMIITLENYCGDVSPFNSVTKMHYIVKRQKLKPLDSMPEPQLIIWVFGYITDLVLSNACPAETMSTRVVGGDAHHRASLVGMGHVKLGLLRHLVDSVFPGTLSPDTVHIIGSKLATFPDYRANHTPYSADKGADTAWLGALPESGRLAVGLLEDPTHMHMTYTRASMTLHMDMPHAASPQDLVFLHNNGTTDAQLRQALRFTKSAPEVWAETDAWRPRWEAIELAAKQEKIANGEAVSSTVPDEAAAAASRDAATAARQLEENVRGGILHVLEPKTLPWYRACAYRAVRTYISLVPEPELGSVLKTNIMNSNLKEVQGVVNRKCVVFLFDATTIGEAANHPAWRFPALAEGRVRKLISAALSARNGGVDTCVPCEGDVFLIFDGGRSSEAVLMTPFRIGVNDVDAMSGPRKKLQLDGDVRKITLGFLESSVLARRARLRGEFDLRQTATMYMVTNKGLKVPQKSYPEYPACTPKGDLIMPIQLPSHSDPTAFSVLPQYKAAIWAVGAPPRQPPPRQRQRKQ